MLFEPDDENRFQLYSNLFLNKFEKKNKKVYDFGLSSKSANVPFGILNEANRGAKRINKNGDYNIPVKTFR